jgi:glucose-1-phosphate adenylyltransferase
MSALPAMPRAALSRTATVLLAGGQGSRLYELTAKICKPALPLFSTHKGPLRMVDFTMANVVRSGLPWLMAATQYQPESLEVHLQRRWAPLFPNSGLVIRNGHALCGSGGYGGTADAVAANRALIDAADAEEVLILSGDHIYQMDYAALVAAHRQTGAMVTLAVQRVPVGQASAFGVIERSANGRIVHFAEKPTKPAEDPDHPGEALVSMGVYVFDWAFLRERLPVNPSNLDFGHDILPELATDGVAAVYLLPALPGQSAPYWRDVGTLDSLRQTLLEFVERKPCNVPVLPGSPFHLNDMPELAVAGVDHERISDSVLLPGARVMAGARLSQAIVAPGTMVPADLEVGVDPAEDARWFRRTKEGTSLITNAMLARRSGRVLTQLRGPLIRAFGLQSMAV